MSVKLKAAALVTRMYTEKGRRGGRSEGRKGERNMGLPFMVWAKEFWWKGCQVALENTFRMKMDTKIIIITFKRLFS